MKERPSKLFRLGLCILRIFRGPYLWAKKKWPKHFDKRLAQEVNLDTSRMLTKFNWLHQLFFGRGFETIRFTDTDLKNLAEARDKGPVVLLMRNWGQVEYNYFNDLFLRKKIPLIVHNNMVRMGHWMPAALRRPLVRKKIDHFFETKQWPYNNEIFQLTETLKKSEPILYCLNLSTGIHWMDETPDSQTTIFKELLQVQATLDKSIQFVPLHFIYDKHPGRAKKSLMDILLGEKENPGYLRKMLLFLRNYQKRAVAKISEPIDFKDLIQKSTGAAPEAISYYCAHHMQKTFDLETKQVTGPKLKSRRALLTKIVENPRMRQKIRQIADQGGLKFEAAEKRTFQYLREIASDIHFTYIELWDYFLTWLFHTLYDGLEVDEVGLAKLKKVAKDSPLILVPSHKSHIDYMLMSYVFYEYDFSLPHVCAGINLSFWPMGPIFRKSGGYFIRRSMPVDPLYPLALKSYVQELMREGYFQEFFIEGTRSRSGKLFPPKMGLLSMMIESFIEDGIEDVYFVPISIGYERIIEESSYLKEIKGAKKKKERFTDLLSLPKFLKRRYGKIYLQFAEPLSLKSLLAKEGKSLLQDPSAFKDFTKDFAQNICMAINEVTVLLPSPLVAIALLSHREKSITRDEIHEKVAALLNVAQQSSARLSRSLRKDAHFAVEEVLEQFVKEGLVRVHQDFQESFYTVPEESRSHLDFFKNKGIHAFAKPGIYQLCLRRSKLTPPPPPSTTPEGRGGTQTLFTATHGLLSKEFFFSPEPIPPGPLPDWMSDLVLPILESYWLTLQAIQRVDFEKIEEKALNRKVLELGETLKLRGSLQYAESLSRFSIQNAVHKFIEMGILKTLQAKTGPSGQHFYAPGHDMEKRREVEQLLKVLLGR